MFAPAPGCYSPPDSVFSYVFLVQAFSLFSFSIPCSLFVSVVLCFLSRLFSGLPFSGLPLLPVVTGWYLTALCYSRQTRTGPRFLVKY